MIFLSSTKLEAEPSKNFTLQGSGDYDFLIEREKNGVDIFLEPKKGTFTFYFNRGLDKYNDGDYYGAISDLSKAIEINPRKHKAYYNRGLAKKTIKDYSGAISDYKKELC